MRNSAPLVPDELVPQERLNDPKALRTLRWTLLFLVLDLTFEGIARKLNIKGMGIAIFLLKDVIVAAVGFQVLRLRRPPAADTLWVAYMVLCVLFLPALIATGVHDPILAVFGAKEYLLYPMVAFGIYIAYAEASVPEVVGFFRWVALLVIPTALVALLELRLPKNSWLNMSVGGTSLEGFSAGGHLRVSSTFPFVAQYCAFINAEVFITMIALNNLRDVPAFRRLVYFSIVPLLLISSYITGSRGAVLVNCVIIAIAAGLSLMKFQARSALRIIVIIGGLLLTLVAVHYALPDAFAAYSTRENGQLLGASSEIQDRIYNAVFGWMSSIFSTPFFGYGIGLMSNGSDLLSSYAASIRTYAWTETDFATTLYEGGIYLVVVWYGFRYFVILHTLFRYLGMAGRDLSVPTAFSVGFIAIIGFSGTLAIQPPVAIWFWLAVGTALLLAAKSNEAKPDDPAPDEPARPPTARKVRGQSAYAARLHAQNKAS